MFSLSDLEPIINSIADPIFVKDRQHRWVLLNGAYCKFMSVTLEEVIGKSDYDFFPQAEADVFWAKDELVFETGTENINDESFTDRSGVTHSITTKKSLYVSRTGEKFIVGCIRDLTDLRRTQQELEHARDRLEAVVCERTSELAAANEALRQQIAENERTADQLRQSQKMEAIGRLAGGIAHDFNNLLNIIIGYSALLENRPDADANLREGAGQITMAAEKAALLTRQLLAFSRKQVLQPEVLNLNDVLVNMGKMLGSSIGEDIALRILPGAVLGCVRADRGQIEQVIMNLAINARDAMQLGGTLTIETSNAEFTDERREEDELGPGQYVLLTVSDTGNGMTPETQAHIFEPFFTTKGPGKGTGLGLATVYGIVRQTSGHIQVHSQIGQGTTLKIYLPRVMETVSEHACAQPLVGKPQGSGTILLVEDQENLRGLFRDVLRGSGYTVLDANCGKTAIEIARFHANRIDLLLTDIVMPRMRGWELASRLFVLRPEMKVLYMSGHTDTDLLKEGALMSGDALLEKPFRPEVLLLKVHDMLSQGTNNRNAKVG